MSPEGSRQVAAPLKPPSIPGGSIRTSLLLRDPGRRVSRAELREFLEELARRILRGRGVVCLLTGDDELRRLNLRFRGLDYATDVLSFPSDSGNAPGEIAISLDRASAQAAGYGHSLLDEIRILMLHGVLHLAGMDHETDTGAMAEAEIRWRRRLDLPTGLIERAAGPRSQVTPNQATPSLGARRNRGTRA
jgi:probable rRNA maturation factor